MEWIYERMKHVHGESEYADYMIRFKSILDKNKNGGGPREEKTTGLNFLEAIHACKAGKNVAMSEWGDGAFMYHSNMKLYWQDGEEAELDMESYLATDWQIVK